MTVQTKDVGEIGEIRMLLPEELHEVDEYKVRGFWPEDEEEEARLIDKFAADIEQNGQQQEVVIDSNNGVITGNRRRRAIAILNGKRSNGSLMRVRCRVEHDPKSYFRKALATNIHNKGYKPMERASLFEFIRKREKFPEGNAGDKLVASYVGVDRATVFMARQLLNSLQPELQKRVASGELTPDAALQIAKEVKEEKQVEAADRARDEQLKAAEKGKKVETRTVTEEKGGRKVETVVPKKVKAPAVRKALSTMKDEDRKSQSAKSKAAIVEWFEMQDGPANSEVVRAFVRYFVDKWAKGQGTDRTLQDKWDAMQTRKAVGRKVEGKAAGKKGGKK